MRKIWVKQQEWSSMRVWQISVGHNAGAVLPSAAPGRGIQHAVFMFGIHIFFEKYALKSVKKGVGRTIAALENVTSGKTFKELDLLTLGKGIERGTGKSLAIHSSFLQTESNQAFANSRARTWLASSGIWSRQLINYNDSQEEVVYSCVESSRDTYC